MSTSLTLIYLALAVLLGTAAFALIWSIPLPARLTTSQMPSFVPAGSVISLNGRRFGRVIRAQGSEILIQPNHPLQQLVTKHRRGTP